MVDAGQAGGAQEDTGTRNTFIIRALQRIVQTCGSQKKYRDVKESSTYAQDFLKDGRTASLSHAVVMSTCFVPLRLAAESKNGKLIEISSGCLQKLMEYAFITGDMRWVAPKLEGVDTKWAQQVQTWGIPASDATVPPKHDHEKQQFIHHVVACICANTSFNDDGVQLEIIKALLTAVSNKACGVHGPTLVMAVRNTFNSYVQSRNQTNQNTAYAALSHMINIVFRRMEDAGLPEVKLEKICTPESKHLSATASDEASVQAEEASADHVASPQGQEKTDDDHHEGGEQSHAPCEDAPEAEPSEDGSYTFVKNEVVDAMVQQSMADETEGGEAPEAPRAETTEEEPAADGEDAPEQDQDDEKFDFDTALAERLAARAGDIAAGTGRRQSSSRKGTERLDGVDIATGMETEAMVFLNQQQKDAYLLFYAFAVLSEKQIADNAPEDSLEMKSKMLSLELLYSVLHSAGPVFLTSERFIKTVKKKLCLSLIQHCVSPMLPVFKMSLQLFLSLVSKFKEHLKREIGFFFTNVFFPILESSNSSYQQKILVLQVLHKVCETPQTIIDIFVNYDCDLQSVNIFEIMVNHLSRLLQGRGLQGGGVEAMKLDSDMRTLALRCLVIIVRSICVWTEKFEEKEDDELRPAGRRGSLSALDVQVSAADLLESSVQETHDHMSTASTPLNAVAATTPTTTTPLKEPEQEGDELQRAKAHKKELHDMVNVFNKSPKKGLQLFWDSGVVAKDSMSTAKFFREQTGLSKDMIGEYMGVLKEFNQKVLSDFVDTFDFSNLEIDEAVRKFMATFRIHGEAQSIDATMEKFAETYTKANQQTFPNASTAYVLSFSIIMLHTDAHSTSIKDKMTRDEFMKNNRGIDDGKNLPDGLLGSIYDRITAKAFELEGSDGEKRKVEDVKKKTVFHSIGVFDRAGNDGKRRQLNYAEESKEMLKKTKALFKTERNEGAYIHASKLEHVRPMFDAGWAALLPAFSVILERCTNEQQTTIDLCLEGFMKSIHISSIFYLDTERDAFVSALSKLTFLNNLREIEPKNIKSIKSLIDLAGKEGQLLRSSWFAILRCFSQLERLQLLGAGAKPDFAFLNEPHPNQPKKGRGQSHHNNSGGLDGTHSSNGSLTNGSMSNQPVSAKNMDSERERIRLEERNSQIVADQIDEVAVSRVYSSTVDLSGEGIVYFVKHLCEVSTEEIEQSHPPRMFSLQKIIEIADVNMSRIRFVWTQLWAHMSKHFIRVGTNKQLFVSMFGIDSLRQLSIKFLDKRELSNYNFQRDFLKPFETIFQESSSIEVRELIVRCMKQIVEGKSNNVKSGWKSIFAVLALAATDKNEQIVALSFEVVHASVSKLFPMVVAADAFVDVVNCLISFSCNTLSPDIAIKSINHLQNCARSLAVGVKKDEQVDAETEEDYILPPLRDGDTIDSEDRIQLRMWFPVFTGLGTGATQHPDVTVRLASINALFEILHSHGCRFTLGMWKIVMSGTIFPIFDNAVCDLCETSTLSTYSPSSSMSIMLAGSSPDDIPPQAKRGENAPKPEANEAAKNMNVIQVGLTFLVALFHEYYHELKHLFGDILNIILTCCKRPTPLKVANYGVSALVDLVGNHCACDVGEISHPYHKDSEASGEEQRSRGLASEKDEAKFFTEEEWKVLAMKMTQSFEAKMLGNKSTCLLEIKSTYTTTARGAERVVVPTNKVNKSEMTLPYQAAMSHLTTLSNLLVTQSLFVKHLSRFWSEGTLVTMLECFQLIHSHLDLLIGGVKEADVAKLANLCEERALKLHLQTILALFIPHERQVFTASGAEGEFDVTLCPHSDTVRSPLYKLLLSILDKNDQGARFDPIIDVAVKGIILLEDKEFAEVHKRFYTKIVSLIGGSPVVQSTVRAFFTKVGSESLGLIS